MLGHYEKVRKIGSGSFGEVYEVRKEGTGEQFAIKKIPIGKDTQSAADNEIRSLSKMKHPNIIKIEEVVDVLHSISMRKMSKDRPFCTWFFSIAETRTCWLILPRTGKTSPLFK